VKKTDAEREAHETIPDRDREEDEKVSAAPHRTKENEIEAELDNESGRRQYVKPEQPW
jgi:hypothetical protein